MSAYKAERTSCLALVSLSALAMRCAFTSSTDLFKTRAKILSVWSQYRDWETRQIENELQNMVARYNIQIDDLIATVSQLKKAREIYLIPINQLEKDRKSTRLNSSHSAKSRMPSSA